jgi:hypothetical protein
MVTAKTKKELESLIKQVNRCLDGSITDKDLLDKVGDTMVYLITLQTLKNN